MTVSITLGEPLISGIIRRGETTALTAPPKSGASCLALGLALAVASGRRWLGRFDTSQGRVVYVDNQHHPGTLADRLKTLCLLQGLNDGDFDDNLSLATIRGKNIKPWDFETLIGEIVEQRPALIIIDGYRVVPHCDRECGISILAINHRPGDVDTRIEMRRTKAPGTMAVQVKARRWVAPAPFLIEWQYHRWKHVRQVLARGGPLKTCRSCEVGGGGRA